jgi:hypothetical protein
MTAADPTPKVIQHACHLYGAYEVPDIDIARLADHLREHLVMPRAVGPREDLVEFVDRDVLVPQEVWPQLPLRHVGRQRTHRKQCISIGVPVLPQDGGGEGGASSSVTGAAPGGSAI